MVDAQVAEGGVVNCGLWCKNGRGDVSVDWVVDLVGKRIGQ